MLKINHCSFDVKFAEINFRQRNYQGKSYVTVTITNEFFPSIVNDNVVYGSVEIKIDLEKIHKIEDLLSKTWGKESGSISISVNNDGVWESNSLDDFQITFEKRENKELFFHITGTDFEYQDSARMVSLFTTSTDEKDLEKKFSLKDFYKKPIKREIGDKVILKYFIQ